MKSIGIKSRMNASDKNPKPAGHTVLTWVSWGELEEIPCIIVGN